jgi:hypothetical protein
VNRVPLFVVSGLLGKAFSCRSILNAQVVGRFCETPFFTIRRLTQTPYNFVIRHTGVRRGECPTIIRAIRAIRGSLFYSCLFAWHAEAHDGGWLKPVSRGGKTHDLLFFPDT